MLNETFFGKFPTPCCHHISCFLKTRQSDILPSRHENPISLFLREHRFFAELRGQLQFFFCLENWLICRSHLKQFIAIQIRKTFLFTFFTTFFSWISLAVVRIFLRSGTLLKNDHFHWFWSVISRFSSIKWRGKMSIWGHFLLVYFLDLLRLVISFHPLDFGTFLKAFVSLLL